MLTFYPVLAGLENLTVNLIMQSKNHESTLGVPSCKKFTILGRMSGVNCVCGRRLPSRIVRIASQKVRVGFLGETGWNRWRHPLRATGSNLQSWQLFP